MMGHGGHGDGFDGFDDPRLGRCAENWEFWRARRVNLFESTHELKAEI
jgi:hypothetical protein